MEAPVVLAMLGYSRPILKEVIFPAIEGGFVKLSGSLISVAEQRAFCGRIISYRKAVSIDLDLSSRATTFGLESTLTAAIDDPDI